MRDWSDWIRSFKRLPSSSAVPPLDAVILPLTSQQISGYRRGNLPSNEGMLKVRFADSLGGIMSAPD